MLRAIFAPIVNQVVAEADVFVMRNDQSFVEKAPSSLTIASVF